MVWQILLVVMLVVANGFFVAAEFALVKVRVTEIETTKADGSDSSRLALHMLEHLDAYLSACQLGITLASLGLGWAGEPVVARLLEPLFGALGLPADKIHYFAFPLAFMVITFLHLTVGEQAPKIGAIQKARATTLLVVYPLSVFYTVFRPFIWLINKSSNAMLGLVGLEPVTEHGQTITEDEVRTILTQSAAMGHLQAREQRIMENVLDLEDKVARRYMVPRHQIVYLDRRDPMSKKLETASTSGHSRLPLCEGDLDGVIGVVHVKDVFRAMTGDPEMGSLVSVSREPLFLPETVKLDSLLRVFQKEKNHLAILVDEYGAVSGMITLEHVIEAMVGPIEDEFDAEKSPITRTGTDRFEVDAACSIDDLARECKVELPEDVRADSVGGLVIEILGRIPGPGEQLRLGEHDITVLASERKRVVRVLVERNPIEPGENPR